MICPKCNHQIEGNVKFCPECGYHFEVKQNLPKASSESTKSEDDRFIVYLLVFAVIGIVLVVYAIGGMISKSNTHTKNSSNQTQSVTFTFPNEQVSFLNSIGIQSIDSASKSGNQAEFKNDGEKITVTFNESGGIVSVIASDDVIWDASSGKIGLTKTERKAFLDNFIDSSSQRYDQALQVTYVDAPDNNAFGHKGLYLYMVIDGKEKNNMKFLYARIHYSDRDWVFFRRIIFSNSKESWEYAVNYFNVTHNVVRGGIHEKISVSLDEIEPGLKILSSGDNPRIDFIGDDRRDSVSVSPAEVEEIKKYLILNKAVKD